MIATTTIGNDFELYDARPQLPLRTGAGIYAFRPRPAGWIEEIVIHHSVTRTLPEDANLGEELSVLGAIHRYHQGPKPDGRWAAIGYHFAVFPSGSCWYVGDLGTSRAHVAQRNPWTAGVLLVGTFTHAGPGERQLEAARRLVSEIQFQLGWFVPVLGHGEASLPGYGTACPGATAVHWLDRVRVTAPDAAA